MKFKIDTDTWFIFCLIFFGILSIFIFLYVYIPYSTRKRNTKRRNNRISRKLENFERVEKKYIQHKIIDLESKNEQLKVTLKEDITKIINSKQDADFEAFFSNFEKLYPDFKTSIYQIAPNLTSNELKLSAFLRLNLSSKEISNLLNITPESVNKARYRLRKKLYLSANEDLSTFILKI
ncbi:helix-turn-helix transcriptional regulator [Polaribacter porphyrae]|uniref:HTH luxR-type domain-containing protein n=1 Tax=Polaribacter porphyrae TaxID=1137780 RepID=A0A2S7WT62_9FLAO|nr:hypothetical protein [Polaribacter porphyrae]PQJ80783.1 hypothetical protein BTO18_17095 [Polaribacter porphyrae]